MKKSHYLGIIAMLIALNLLVFSCHNDTTSTSNEAKVEKSTVDEAETVAVEEKAEPTLDEEDGVSEEETAVAEKTDDDASHATEEVKKEKPATMNTPAAPPNPKKAAPKKPKKPAAPMAKFQFDKKVHEFGTIKVGTKVEHDFHFTNAGEVPLVITGANSTCGCTIPEFSKEPIPPGGRGKVKVTFDSTGKIGMQDKHVTISANTYPKNTVIHMKGLALTENMMPKKNTAASPSPYSSPKLSQPAAPPTNNNTPNSVDGGSSLVPTADKPKPASSSSAEQNTVDNKEDQ